MPFNASPAGATTYPTREYTTHAIGKSQPYRPAADDSAASFTIENRGLNHHHGFALGIGEPRLPAVVAATPMRARLS